jgi:hypothetical protein
LSAFRSSFSSFSASSIFLRQLSEWQGLLAQNVPIARQILRKVLEGRLVFVPRHEGAEHWYEFAGEARGVAARRAA